MKSKERPRVLTKENPIHEAKKDHEGPKSQKEGKKKEIIITIKKKEEDLGQVRGHAARILVRGHAAKISVRLEDMQQRSRSGQMICSKKNQHQGPMYVQTHTKAIKNPTKTKYYLHNPWSKPVGSQMGSDFW